MDESSEPHGASSNEVFRVALDRRSDFKPQSPQSTMIDTHRFFILRIEPHSLLATFEWRLP